MYWILPRQTLQHNPRQNVSDDLGRFDAGESLVEALEFRDLGLLSVTPCLCGEIAVSSNREPNF
jgi:hypothetical protein